MALPLCCPCVLVNGAASTRRGESGQPATCSCLVWSGLAWHGAGLWPCMPQCSSTQTKEAHTQHTHVGPRDRSHAAACCGGNHSMSRLSSGSTVQRASSEHVRVCEQAQRGGCMHACMFMYLVWGVLGPWQRTTLRCMPVHVRASAAGVCATQVRAANIISSPTSVWRDVLASMDHFPSSRPAAPRTAGPAAAAAALRQLHPSWDGMEWDGHSALLIPTGRRVTWLICPRGQHCWLRSRS